MTGGLTDLESDTFEIICFEVAKELLISKQSNIDEKLLVQILENDKTRDNFMRRAIDASVIYQMVKGVK